MKITDNGERSAFSVMKPDLQFGEKGKSLANTVNRARSCDLPSAMGTSPEIQGQFAQVIDGTGDQERHSVLVSQAR